MRKLLTFDVPEDADEYGQLTVEQLDTLQTLAVQAAAPLRVKGIDEVTDDDVALLQDLADVAVNAKAAKAAHAARAEAFAQAIDATDPSKQQPDQAPVPDGLQSDADDEAEEEAEPAKTREPASVAAAGKKAAPRIGDVAQGTKHPAVTVGEGEERYATLVAASDVPGYPTGQEYESMVDVGRAVERRMNTYSGRQGGYARNGVAVFKRDFPEEFTQNASGDDDLLLEYAALETRLPGGNLINSVEQQVKAGKSLTAAAGWCAPSQTVYDLFELETANSGLVDLPEIQITRGGLRFTPGPVFADIFAGTGYFHQTEAQVISATTKPCMVVPCPTFVDVRLDIEGVCITGAILQQRGYPEMVARFVRGAMAVHAHKLNQFIIAQLVAGSTTVDLSPHPVATAAAADDTSATTLLLSHLELAAVDYKYRHRMQINGTLEAIFPLWTLPVMRADLSRRTGVPLENVTDEFLIAQMRARGIRPQFVYDWQDAFAGLAAGPGGATALSHFPVELEFLLYAAGTFVRGSADVITLDTVYDAANLALNQFTALFTEEGVLVAKLGHDARRYVVPFCPTGATSATVAINCA